jgi:RNA polymerase sigma-70 factor (ECF subfamily)
MSDASEQALIANAVEGDRVALGELLMSHYAALSRHIAFLIPARLAKIVSVDDVVQQTYVQAMRGIARFEARDGAGFLTWLRAIAANQVRDFVAAFVAGKRGGQLTSAGASEWLSLAGSLSGRSEPPSGPAARREMVAAIHVGMADLPDSQRQAVQLHHLGGNSVEETAARMNRSPGAIKGLLHRARQALRDAMGRSSRWFSRG